MPLFSSLNPQNPALPSRILEHLSTRLAAKLVLLFLTGLLLVVGLFSYLTVRQEQRAQAEHQRFASELVQSLQPNIDQASSRGGEENDGQMVFSNMYSNN